MKNSEIIKKIAIQVLLGILVMLVVYVIFAFVKAEPNPIYWSESERVMCCVFWMGCSFSVLGIYNS